MTAKAEHRYVRGDGPQPPVDFAPRDPAPPEAARTMRRLHPEVDILVSDDGLQHLGPALEVDDGKHVRGQLPQLGVRRLQRGEPGQALRVAEEVAKIKCLPVDEAMYQLTVNTCRVFDLVKREAAR